MFDFDHGMFPFRPIHDRFARMLLRLTTAPVDVRKHEDSAVREKQGSGVYLLS